MRPLALAITGGIGAGKSAALAAFARQGVPTASSDEIVHRLLASDEEVARAIRERYGKGILLPGGGVDRRGLGQVVFADPDELRWLEALLHPRVRCEYAAWRGSLARLPTPPAVCVVEVPLLYETGAETGFDGVVAITAPPEVCAARACVPPDDRAKRLLPDEEKVRRANYAYVNDGTLDELDRFVRSVLAELAERG